MGGREVGRVDANQWRIKNGIGNLVIERFFKNWHVKTYRVQKSDTVLSSSSDQSESCLHFPLAIRKQDPALSTLSDSCKLRNFTVSRGHITRTYVNAWRSWLNKRSEFLCPLLYIQNYRFFDSEVKTFCYDFSNCNCGTKIWWERVCFCFTDWKCVWLLSISGVLCSRQHLEKVKTMWYTTTLGLGQLSQVFKIF